MAIERILNDVPESEVNEVVGDLESEGCTVKKEKQNNGLWTIKASCPEKSS